MNHSDRAHAKYSASGYDRYSRCPGSVRLLEKLKPYTDTLPPSEWAEEGSRAHELLELALKNGDRDVKAYEWMIISSAGTELTAEHTKSVQVFLDWFWPIIDDNPDAAWGIEQSFSAPQKIVPPDECGGTCDVWIYLPSKQLLIVPDFKHGAGVPVEIDENRQTRVYALMVESQLNFEAALAEQAMPIELIQTVIIQPRAFHPHGPIRFDFLTPLDLKEFQSELEFTLERCEDPEAPLIPGYLQCRWCDAAVACPAREAKALGVIGVPSIKDVGPAVLPPPENMTPDRIAYVMQAGRELRQWLDQIDEYAAERAINGGVYFPGFKIVPSLARRRFVGEPVDVAAKFVDTFPGVGMNDIFPRKLLGIGEAESLVTNLAKAQAPKGKKMKAAEQAKEAMAFLTIKDTSGKLLLVPESDKRPAVSPAARHFEGVNLPQIEAPE